MYMPESAAYRGALLIFHFFQTSCTSALEVFNECPSMIKNRIENFDPV